MQHLIIRQKILDEEFDTPIQKFESIGILHITLPAKNNHTMKIP
jgi:hypothetical protein